MAGQLVAIQAFLSAGNPAAGAKFYTYAAGTLTPKAAYADEAGTVPLSNPVTANAYGIMAFWLKDGIGDYKLEMKDSTGAVILMRVIDNFTPAVDSIYQIIGENIAAIEDAVDAQLALAETAAANAAASAGQAATSETNAAASAVATAADAVATAADRAAVAADKVTVATDKAVVAADKATTEGYKNASLAAQTASETAQGLSEAARDDTAAWTNAAVDTPVEGVTGDSFTFNPQTDLNTTTNVITEVAHGLSNDQPVTYRNGGGTAPAGLVHNTQYWAEYVTADTFKLKAARFGATAIDITDTGTGTAHEIFFLRSAKHQQAYAQTDRIAGEAAAQEAIEQVATLDNIYIGDYANDAAAWADPNAATGVIYKNTGDNKLYILAAAAPNADPLAPLFATQAQAEAGTNDLTQMNPLRTAQAIAALAPSPVIASQAEAEAGTENTKTITPLRMAQGAPTIIFGSKERWHTYFGIVPGAMNMTPWNNAWGALNDGTINTLRIGAGLFPLDDATNLPLLDGGSASATEDFISIIGSGPATRLQVEAGAGTVGRLFNIGGAGDYLRRFLIDGFDISFLNTPNAAEPVFDVGLARDFIVSRIGGRAWGKAFKLTQGGLINLVDWNIEAGVVAGSVDAIFDFNNASVVRMHRVDYGSAVFPGNVDADGCFVSLQSAAAGANIDTFEALSCGFQLFSKTGAAADGRPVGYRFRKPSGSSGSLTNGWIRGGYCDHTTVKAVDFLVDPASTNSNSRVLEFKGTRYATDKGDGLIFDNQTTDETQNAYTGLVVEDNQIIVQTNNPGIKLIGSVWNGQSVKNNKIRERFGLTADRFNDMIDYAIGVGAPNVNIDENEVGSDDGLGYVRVFDGSSASIVSTANDTLTLSAVTTFNPTGVVDTGTDVLTIVAHGFIDNQKLRYRDGGGTAIGGLTDDTDVFIRDATDDTFKLAATEGGAAINLTSLGTGTAHELIVGHGYDNGMNLIYSAGGGTAIAGLTDGQIYVVRDATHDTLKLNQGGAAAIDFTALGVGSSHSLKLVTRFKAFVQTIAAGVSNLQIGAGNKVDCKTYFDEATYPTVPYGNNRILDPKIVHEESHYEWQTRKEFFDEIASGTATQANAKFWNSYKGSDGTALLPYIDATAERGLLTMDIKNTVTKTMAVNGGQVIGPTLYRTLRGLVVEGTVTFNDIADGVVFFGLTDQNAALEMPMEHDGASVIANATDAVGFLADVNFSTDNWRCVAANTGTVRNFDSGDLHVNSVNKHFRIEIDYRGNADFFIDGVWKGHITTAVPTGINLAPTWACFSRNGGFFGRMDRFKIAIRADKPA